MTARITTSTFSSHVLAYHFRFERPHVWVDVLLSALGSYIGKVVVMIRGGGVLFECFSYTQLDH